MLPRLALVSLALFLLQGPAPAAAPYQGHDLSRFSFAERHMGTRFEIICYARDEATASAAAKAAFARIAELNAIMSDYLSTSELMRLCSQAGGPPVKVSRDLFTILKRAQDVSRRSDGGFDVTVGPVVRLWRQARRTQRLPESAKLAAARALVGYKNVVLDDKAQTVRLLLPGMQLDLGGIAKGYAADQVHAVLARHGITRALVAAGGDITVKDPPPGRKGWSVSIAPVEGPADSPTADRLLLAHASVSTSGDAEQYTEINGVRYSHIVDPRTGLGLVGRMSATVIAPTGVQADSLTKVVAVLGPEQGFKILRAEKGTSSRFILKTDKGVTVKATANFADWLEKPAREDGKKVEEASKRR